MIRAPSRGSPGARSSSISDTRGSASRLRVCSARREISSTGAPSGALATLRPPKGDPYCSLVNVASDACGAPILLISRLAVHTANLLADPRVSLMLDERAPGDPLEGARIMLAGTAEEASGAAEFIADEDLTQLCRLLLNANEFVYVD